MLTSSQIVLTTDRLLLKGITPQLIHDLFNTKSKEEIITYFGFDESSYEHFKGMHEKGMETHRTTLFFFLVVFKETNEPIGECGFHTWDFKHRRAELFYSLRSDEYKRKGIMTEALTEVLKYGYNKLKIHRIEALVADWNKASVQLLKHFNFIKEGTMREDYLVDGKNEDSDCYSLLKWEWKKGIN